MGPFHRRTAGVAALVATGVLASSAQQSRRFDIPRERGYRVDVCLNWGADCGKPAADVFCRRNGFPAAESFEIAENIGAARPTITLGDQRICNHPDCDGFKSITCQAAAPERTIDAARAVRALAPDPEPSIALIRYLPPRGYDPQFLCWGIMTRDTPSMKKGQRLWTCGGSSGGGLGDIVEGLGGAFIEGVGGLASLGAPVVNWAASKYNSVKSTAVGFVTDSLKNTVGCGRACQWAVGAAVDAGMMAMGIPPSIPDFDQLVGRLEDQGVDALADAAVSAAASQGVPLPKEVAKAAIQKLKNDAVAAAASGAPGGNTLFKPDPNLAYRPASMLFEARNADNNRTTAATTLRLINGHSQKGPGPYDFITTGGGGGRFQTANISLPALKPRSSVRFVVTLEPLQDPHAWLSIRDEAQELFKKAHARPCQAPASFTPDPESPAYKTYKKCEEDRKAKAAILSQASSQKFVASNANRDAWTKTYTTSELGFETWLLGARPERGAFLRCPPHAPTCSAEFAEPSWNGRRVDFCLAWGRDCGQPAASMYCGLQGYLRALSYVPAKGIGATIHTYTLIDHRICDQPACTGFERIVCGQ